MSKTFVNHDCKSSLVIQHNTLVVKLWKVWKNCIMVQKFLEYACIVRHEHTNQCCPRSLYIQQGIAKMTICVWFFTHNFDSKAWLTTAIWALAKTNNWLWRKYARQYVFSIICHFRFHFKKCGFQPMLLLMRYPATKISKTIEFIYKEKILWCDSLIFAGIIAPFLLQNSLNK